MKEKDFDTIIEDMKVAGCSKSDIERVINMHKSGMDPEILQCLRKCRCDMLDELHDKQRGVDRLDRLIRNIKR